MLSNLVLGPQGNTPAQDTGARVYWDRTVPGKAFDWILPLSQRGSYDDVGDTVTSYRKAALLGPPAVHPRGGDVPSPSLKDLMELPGLLFPLLQSTTFGLFFLTKRKFSFLSFLSWQVP